MPQHALQDECRFMEPLQLAGRLIMENGGETYRVEETITRMGRAFGLEGVESFAVPSGLFVSYRLSDGSTETAVHRVRKGATNLTRVDQVNQVSRRVEAGTICCEEAMLQLRAIEKSRPPVSPQLSVLAAAVCSGGFAVMFGGRYIEFFVAAAAAALTQLMTLYLQKRKLGGAVLLLAGSVLSALMPMLFNRLTGLCLVNATVAGALMPMLPGLAMTNGVQDTTRGDILSGTSHAISAILTAVLVAGGALVAAEVMNLL